MKTTPRSGKRLVQNDQEGAEAIIRWLSFVPKDGSPSLRVPGSGFVLVCLMCFCCFTFFFVCFFCLFWCVCVCVCVCPPLFLRENKKQQGAQAHCGYLCQRSYSTMGEAESDQLRVPAMKPSKSVPPLQLRLFPGHLRQFMVFG